MALFTVNMQIAGWPCLVAGGGAIALHKAGKLLEAGAEVTLVAPAFQAPLPGARLVTRPVEPADLAGVRLAIFATDDRNLNAEFYEEARRRGILAAAVDDLGHADFFMPASFRRGDLEVAVSSSGRCPAYAVWVRDRLAEVVEASWGDALGWLARLRETQLAGLPYRERAEAFRRILTADFRPACRDGELLGRDAPAASVVRGS